MFPLDLIEILHYICIRRKKAYFQNKVGKADGKQEGIY